MNYGIKDVFEEGGEMKSLVTANHAKYANRRINLTHFSLFEPLYIKRFRRSPRQSNAVAPSFLAV
jgi:hypothetical protein